MDQLGSLAMKGRQCFPLFLLMLGLTACGGGGGGGEASNPVSQTKSAALMSGAPLAASYSVVNLHPYGGWAYPKGINATGQVTFYGYDPTTGTQRAYIHNGTVAQALPFVAGHQYAFSVGINDLGQIAGNSYGGSAGQRAFSWSPTGDATGVLTDLGSLGGGWSYATGINNSGQVTGSTANASGQQRAFSWNPTGPTTGAMTDLGSFAGPHSWGEGINNSGKVTGFAYNAIGQYRAFSWSPTGPVTGVMTDLGSLGGGYSQGQVINDVGQVAGASYDGAGHWRPFIWNPTNSVMTDLGSLGGTHGWPFGMNNSGQVVGYSHTASGYYHAFSWSPTGATGGVMTDLGTFGGDYSYAFGINNAGQAVGYAYTTNNQQVSAFAWTATDGRVDLNTRIPTAPPGLHLYHALAISDNGSIVASSSAGLILLIPGVTSSAAPTLGPITANDPVPVGSPVTVSASFTDADSADTHTATWAWGDASTAQTGTVTESSGSGNAAGSHVYTAAGVYQVSVQVTDNTGKTAQVSRDVVVYDPSAGFVTGGGWIMSPPGAYKKEPTLGGRATYGFVSKYQRGATKPIGKTEFQFHAANLNFHSENYEWLVVAGARAQYKGGGTINGSGDFKFLLTAIDGNVTGGGGKDRFRIKIWHYNADTNADVVDYDNQLDTTLEGGTNEGTVIGGGSIVIHK